MPAMPAVTRLVRSGELGLKNGPSMLDGVSCPSVQVGVTSSRSTAAGWAAYAAVSPLSPSAAAVPATPAFRTVRRLLAAAVSWISSVIDVSRFRATGTAGRAPGPNRQVGRILSKCIYVVNAAYRPAVVDPADPGPATVPGHRTPRRQLGSSERTPRAEAGDQAGVATTTSACPGRTARSGRTGPAAAR